MDGYSQTSIITEHTPSFALLQAGGCEVYNNERDLMIRLTKETVVMEGHVETFFSSTYYAKEGNGWEKMMNNESYRTLNEFLLRLRDSEEMSHAHAELRRLLSDK